jgi:hypothetical protein
MDTLAGFTDHQGMPRDDPSDKLKPELAITALTFYVDVNFIDDESPHARGLRRAHQEGWVRLLRTDTLDTELSKAGDDHRSALLNRSGGTVALIDQAAQATGRRIARDQRHCARSSNANRMRSWTGTSADSS